MIICTKCKIEQDTTCFSPDNKKKNGLKSYCKACQSIYDIKRYRNNPEKEKQRVQTYRDSLTKEQRFIYNRKTKLKKDYNLTLEQYDLMLKEQNGVCYICNNPPTKKLLAVDHCHNTNKIRKLLCTNCNTALGLFKDNIEVLQKAVKYLKDTL